MVYITPLLTIGASFLGAWLAARFALRRFYQERLWDRKTAAYSIIFEALFDMGVWYERHLTLYFRQQEMDEGHQATLLADYQAARKILQRRLAAESWLIPDACKRVLDDTFQEVDREPENFFLMLESGSAAISDATKELTTLVRVDLKLKVF